MTKIPFPLKGQTTGTIRTSSTFLKKNPTTTLSGELTSTKTTTHHCSRTPTVHHHINLT
ncbi:hypothetical protein Hanom_Chr00s005950g01731481 [Helianthus anomalus]